MSKTQQVPESLDLFGNMIASAPKLPDYVQVGNEYETEGKWTARVVYITHDRSWLYAVHKPDCFDESPPVAHDWMGKSMTSFSVNAPPTYNQSLPSDLIFKKPN